jgi:hypothetical protein
LEEEEGKEREDTHGTREGRVMKNECFDENPSVTIS